LKSLAETSSVKKRVRHLTQIYLIVTSFETTLNDVLIATLDAMLWKEATALNDDDVEPGKTRELRDSIIESTKKRLLNRFREQPILFVDQMLKVANWELVISKVMIEN
jgi:hypothetical protein